MGMAIDTVMSERIQDAKEHDYEYLTGQQQRGRDRKGKKKRVKNREL